MIVLDVQFSMDWKTKKKVKPSKYDRLGLTVGFTKQPFDSVKQRKFVQKIFYFESIDSANLGPYQTVSKDGLNFYFTRDSKEKTEYFGRAEYPEKMIIDLPSVGKNELTLVQPIDLFRRNLRVRFTFDFNDNTYFVTGVDQDTQKKIPLVGRSSIPDFLRNSSIFLTLYAYNGFETVGTVHIKEITVRESLKKVTANFDKDLKKINRKMINDLIHSHVRDKKNRTLLSVMINEEEIKREVGNARKLSKMLHKDLEGKMFKEGAFGHTNEKDQQYDEKYKAMIEKLTSMVNSTPELKP